MIYTVMNRPEMMMDRMMRDMCGMPPHGPQPGPNGPRGPHGPHRPPMGFPVDVKKADAAYILTAELPGVKMDDIAITVEDDVLTIAAHMTREPREEHKAYVIRERGPRPDCVERSFRLEGIDQNAITASAADGVLTIVLPKEAPAEGKGPRRIAINGAAPVPAIEAPAE